MVRNDIKNSSLLKTKFLIYAFNGRTLKIANLMPFMPLRLFIQSKFWRCCLRFAPFCLSSLPFVRAFLISVIRF